MLQEMVDYCVREKSKPTRNQLETNSKPTRNQLETKSKQLDTKSKQLDTKSKQLDTKSKPDVKIGTNPKPTRLKMERFSDHHNTRLICDIRKLIINNNLFGLEHVSLTRTLLCIKYELHRTEIAQPVARAFGVPTVFPIVILPPSGGES